MKNTNACHQCHSFQTTGFNLLSEGNRLKLDDYKRPKFFKKNEIIFSQGEQVTDVFCMRSGLVKLETVGSDGHSVTLGLVKGGDLLGFSSVLSKAPSTTSAVAIEDSAACAYSANFFYKILEDTPQLAIQYLGQIFNELREARGRILSGVDKDVPSRVAEALIYLKAHYPDHNFTRREIAEWAGTTTESVIRALSNLEDDGIIMQKGRQIMISNLNELNNSAGILI